MPELDGVRTGQHRSGGPRPIIATSIDGKEIRAAGLLAVKAARKEHTKKKTAIRICRFDRKHPLDAEQREKLLVALTGEKGDGVKVDISSSDEPDGSDEPGSLDEERDGSGGTG